MKLDEFWGSFDGHPHRVATCTTSGDPQRERALRTQRFGHGIERGKLIRRSNELLGEREVRQLVVVEAQPLAIYGWQCRTQGDGLTSNLVGKKYGDIQGQERRHRFVASG